jgi:hypothetical protein
MHKQRLQAIDVRDRRQVDHWSRYFGVTPTQLTIAIEKTSGNAVDVGRLLSKQ